MILLEHGANREIKDSKEKAPMEAAEGRGRDETISELS